MKNRSDIDRRIGYLYDEMPDPNEEDPILGAKVNALDWVLGVSGFDLVSGEDEVEGMKTEMQVQEMIPKLEEEKKTYPEYSAFGDANWEEIDAEIQILRWVLAEGKD